MRYRLRTLPVFLATPIAILAPGSFVLAWTHSNSTFIANRLFALPHLQAGVLLSALAIVSFFLADSLGTRPLFRFSIRDLLLLTAGIAFVLALIMTMSRAQRTYHDLVTCGPNTLLPGDLGLITEETSSMRMRCQTNASAAPTSIMHAQKASNHPANR
jgi:hypothetical protein